MMHLKDEGAKTLTGMGLQYRNYEPIDVFIPLWRKIKSGHLPSDTQSIIDKYFMCGIEPSRTSKDYATWQDVITKLKPVLIDKQIVERGEI